MNRKGLVLLALVAVVLVAGYFWLNRPTDSLGSADREPWLPELKSRAGAISGIEIEAAGEPAVRIARQDNQWVLPAKEGYSAASQGLADLLRALLEAEKVEPRTANPELHGRLGLAEEGEGEERAARLKLSFSEGEPIALRIGKAAGQGGQLVRRAGDNQVWRINRDIPLAGEELEWLDRRVTSIPFASIREVQVRHADGEELTAFRDKAEQSNLQLKQLPKGRELAYEAAANGMATLFANLRLNDALPLAQLPFDREKPLLRFSLQTFEDGRLGGAIYRHGDHYWLTLDQREGLGAEQVPLREGWAARIENHHYQALGKRLKDLLGKS